MRYLLRGRVTVDFLLVHPLGTVLGRGNYKDYFMAYQRCGIGSNHDIYPRLGRNVTLRPGSSVLGNCDIGDNVTIAADSLVLDYSVASESVYFGKPRDHWTRLKTSPEYSYGVTKRSQPHPFCISLKAPTNI